MTHRDVTAGTAFYCLIGIIGTRRAMGVWLSRAHPSCHAAPHPLHLRAHQTPIYPAAADHHPLFGEQPSGALRARAPSARWKVTRRNKRD